MTLRSVDFPAPFSPRKARISPGRASSDTSFNAWTLGKALLTPRISRPVPGMAGSGGGDADRLTRASVVRRGDVTGAGPSGPAPVTKEERDYLLQLATDVLSMTVA